MSDSTAGSDLIFETSWEVCNKVGGIYTVLSTKAKTLQKFYKDKVVFVGPDVWTAENPSPCFIESSVAPLRKWFAQASLPQGVTVRIGRWDIPGKPLAVLVGFQGMYALKDKLYGRMWERFGVDSLHAYGDYDEACAFSHAAALVIEDIARFNGIAEGKRMIAHFDEWTTGMGLLIIKDVLPQMATVFTTHATCIGRSICGNGKPLYEYLHAYNGDQMAAELNMQSKHSLEKAAAHNADCFTTVSEITARECEQLLERRPDVVTPNGFEENFTPTKAAYPKARQAARKQMLKVASALAGKDFPDDTFIVVTSGRCEFRNKGIDLFLDSMQRLGQMNPPRKVLAFVMVPAWMKQPRQDLMDALSAKPTQSLNEPFVSHDLNNPWEDAILCSIRYKGLTNCPDAPVSVVYVPCYLNGNDGIFNMSYYDLLPGADATVFPSYYEPWGYTPLESIAFGVPTVTTSLSGFGQWILADFPNSFAETGVRVESRGDTNYHEVKEAIASDIRQLACLAPQESEGIADAARNTASMASWKHFIAYYERAFEIAYSNVEKQIVNEPLYK